VKLVLKAIQKIVETTEFFYLEPGPAQGYSIQAFHHRHDIGRVKQQDVHAPNYSEETQGMPIVAARLSSLCQKTVRPEWH
jgi:hypothetical protein